MDGFSTMTGVGVGGLAGSGTAVTEAVDRVVLPLSEDCDALSEGSGVSGCNHQYKKVASMRLMKKSMLIQEYDPVIS